MNKNEYYRAYENRYKKVYAAGVDIWGHTPDDKVLYEALEKWVNDSNLRGKKVIEFACGEGASGVILSNLGCIYHGVDISPTAVEKAKSMLIDYPDAKVFLHDMVKDSLSETYSAAFDSMGLHMLVTDADRNRYLSNAYAVLENGAPMLFFRETFRESIYEGVINSIDEWIALYGEDYVTPAKRVAYNGDEPIEVYIPLVPARARSKAGYTKDMTNAGFIIDDFKEMEINNKCVYSVSIYVHKP